LQRAGEKPEEGRRVGPGHLFTSPRG
jgi:hypothetical protein